MLPLSLLKAAQDNPMLVELKNGETYNGHLVNCDNWMNIQLKEVICTSRDGDKFWKIPECFIKGSTIKYLRIPDEIIDKVKEEAFKPKFKAGGGPRRGGGSRQGAPRGRGGRGGGGGGGRGGKKYYKNKAALLAISITGYKTTEVNSKRLAELGCRENFQISKMMQTCIFHLLLVLSTCRQLMSAEIIEDDDRECINSYLWKVEVEPPVYLFGTLHVPYTKIWNRIPENVQTAISLSDNVNLELLSSDPETRKILTNCQFLPKDVTVKTILPSSLYERIKKYLDTIKELFPLWAHKSGTINFALSQNNLFNAFIHDWERRRPIWLLFLLDSLTKDTVQNRQIPLLDNFLSNAAKGMNKEVNAIENVKDQCRPFNNLDQTHVMIALNKQLDYLEPLATSADGPPSTEDQDIDTYQCGDFETLVKTESILPLPSLANMSNLTVQESEAILEMNEYLEKQLIFRRNRKMTRYIQSLLHNPSRNETSFFAIGAGHFLGRKGIVEILRRNHYIVTNIPLTLQIEGPALPTNIIGLGDPSSIQTLITLPPEEVTTPPQTTLSTLSEEKISEIFQKVLNNTAKYRIDSVEVTSTPSPSTSPSSSPIIKSSIAKRSIAMATNNILITTTSLHYNDIHESDDHSSAIRTTINPVILITCLLVILSRTLLL